MSHSRLASGSIFLPSAQRSIPAHIRSEAGVELALPGLECRVLLVSNRGLRAYVQPSAYPLFHPLTQSPASAYPLPIR